MGSARPTFSVIVAAHNSADRLGATMRSVLAQTRSDLELIVVDDGSTDATAAGAQSIAAVDGRARVLRQENRGTVGARNRGIEEAGGAYLSFLDDDDLWLPSYLERVAGGFERYDDAGLVHGDAWVLDTATGAVGGRSAAQRFARPVRALEPAPPPLKAEKALLRVNFITTCATTVSRRALDRVGALDPGIRGCDDWDLWLRIVGAGFRAVRVDERLAVLRKRADSVGGDSLMMAEGSRQALERALERGVGSPAAERTARRHARLLEWEIAARCRGRIRGGLASVARRLGRKRLPLGRAAHRRPPAELDRMLACITASGR